MLASPLPWHCIRIAMLLCLLLQIQMVCWPSLTEGKVSVLPRLPCREMERVAALVNSVSGTFGRRDFLRRNMDKIEAMIADSGALLGSAVHLLICKVYHIGMHDAIYLWVGSVKNGCWLHYRRVCGISDAGRSCGGVL